MRLLHTDTSDDQLKLFAVSDPDSPPPYVILSHTWIENEEITFQDLQSNNPAIRNQSGYQKILGTCQRAREDGYEYVWIDTCCIDKTSSAELSEAINSMFKWYQRALMCIVYLHDVSAQNDPGAKDSEFRRSRWFTRGWTLQELIAPAIAIFYTVDWKLIGDKKVLATTIEDITRIDSRVLILTRAFKDISVAMKMSWAANRSTTRIEDRAYSLMGLFGVNMPTIYGEGARAFTRLQHEIMAISADYSIFAWNIFSGSSDAETGILADSPDRFSKYVNVVNVPYDHFTTTWGLEDAVADFQRTPRGIQLTLPVFEVGQFTGPTIRVPGSPEDLIAVVPCKILDTVHVQVYSLGLVLRRDATSYVRVHPKEFVHIDCLLDMDIPWSVKPVMLMYNGIKEDSTIANIDGPASALEFSISAYTLTAFRDCGGFTIVPSPDDPEHKNFAKLHGTIPIERLSRQMTYIKTEEGNFVFTVSFIEDKWKGIIFKRHAPETSAEEESYFELVFVSENCGHGPDPMFYLECQCSHFKSERGKKLRMCFDSNSTTTYQCGKCGLVIDGETFCAPSLSKTDIPHYILNIRRRGDLPWKSDDIATPFRKQSIMNYKLPSSPRWVESTAGFVPWGSFKCSSVFEFRNTVSIARVTYQYMTSGLSSSSPTTYVTNLPAMKGVGRLSAELLQSYEDHEEDDDNGYEKDGESDNEQSKQSRLFLGYEVLVGPQGSIRWVECKGKFSLGMFTDTPIEGGRDKDGVALYFSRGSEWKMIKSQCGVRIEYLGVVKEGCLPSVKPAGSGKHDQYSVLVYA